MEVSIIVPIYNVENYIEECVESLINQKTDVIYEIILVNDGTKDKSREKIEKYKELENVKIVDKENGGLSSARNAGLDVASGKYILFIDSDDFVLDDFVEKLYSYANSNELDVAFSAYKFYFDANNIKNYKGIYSENEIFTREEALKNLLVKKTFRTEVWDDIYKREFLVANNLRFTEGVINEDEEFTAMVLATANKIGYLNYYGYMYRQREGSITKVKNYTKTIESRVKMMNNLIAQCKKMNGVEKEFLVWRLKDLFTTLGVDVVECKEKKYDISEIVKFLIDNYNGADSFEVKVFDKSPKLYQCLINGKLKAKKVVKKIIRRA